MNGFRMFAAVLVGAALLIATALRFSLAVRTGDDGPPGVADGHGSTAPAVVARAAAPAGRAVRHASVRARPLRDVVLAAGRRLAEVPDADERCLAQAVYFESRSEPLAGQLAVAQVVLNRVRSPAWPDSVCAVVFQNERWRHRCQFSFACDGRSDRPREARAWRIARMVARVALDGDWPDITRHATHYHADYVRPAWQAAMIRTARYGRHLFYRDDRSPSAAREVSRYARAAER